MPIEIACPSCAALLRAPDKLAGKQAKCPKCGKPVPVPAPSQDVDVDLICGHPEDVPVDDDTADEVIDDLQDDEPIVRRGRRQEKSGKLLWMALPLGGLACITVGIVIGVAITFFVMTDRKERLPQVVEQASKSNNKETAEEKRATVKANQQSKESSKAPPGLTEKQKTAAADAVKALGRIEGAVQVGVNFKRYGELVGDAKAVVNEAERTLPVDDLSLNLNAAMLAYGDANTVWNEKIQHGILGLRQEFHGEIIARYDLHPRGQEGDHDVAMQTMWVVGAKAVANARNLLAEIEKTGR
jgi:hypothetical protein